jgi:hypothetical protein
MLGLARAVVRRAAASSAPLGRRLACTLEHEKTFAPRPSNVSLLTVCGVLVVLPLSVYGGAELARSMVAYVEDNDIWRPEEDDG